MASQDMASAEYHVDPQFSDTVYPMYCQPRIVLRCLTGNNGTSALLNHQIAADVLHSRRGTDILAACRSVHESSQLPLRPGGQPSAEAGRCLAPSAASLGPLAEMRLQLEHLHVAAD